MLGYIMPEKPELKIKEFEIYSAYYCGICKSIGKRYGQLPRMALSYDSVFLALILAGINPEIEKIKIERCIVHPLKKRSIVYDCKEIDYAADILLLLAYYKLKDDIQDESKKKAIIGAALMKGTFKKLMITNPEKCKFVQEKITELSGLEEQSCASIDRSAEPFAKLMEEVFDITNSEEINHEEIDFQELNQEELNQIELKQNLRSIGYHVGKWIYLIDAYDDIEENLKENSFNPLLNQFKYDKNIETTYDFRNRIKERVEMNLMLYLAEIAKLCGQLKIEKNKGLIENILYFGLMRKTEEIVKKGNEINAKSI